MYAVRIPAINKLPKPTEAGADQGWTGAMLENILPREVQWKAHNYNHLHEAPTVFYAVALALAMIGFGDGMNATIAWVYVGLRIVHSVFQSGLNVGLNTFTLGSALSVSAGDYLGIWMGDTSKVDFSLSGTNTPYSPNSFYASIPTVGTVSRQVRRFLAHYCLVHFRSTSVGVDALDSNKAPLSIFILLD